MRDNPSLSQIPLAIGGSPEKRGVVATCNYPARKFGIHSAMPMSKALRACPELKIIPPRINKYREESLKIRKIFSRYTEKIEPLSLDEAFLDVSDNQMAQGSATRIAEHIRNSVREEVGVTISAGIAANKFLAKIASDWNKPDGQFTITPADAPAFIDKLPVAKIFGVGKVTARKMHDQNLKTCLDLKKLSLTQLTTQFGKFGARLYELCRGIDNRPVNPSRQRKSLSAETTFVKDLANQEICLPHILQLTNELERRIAKTNHASQICRLTMKIKFNNFKMTTASKHGRVIKLAEYEELFIKAWRRQSRPVRLLGVGVDIANDRDESQNLLF